MRKNSNDMMIGKEGEVDTKANLVEVKVTFASTRNKFGSSSMCSGRVESDFFQKLTSVNKILIQGWNEEKEAKQKKNSKLHLDKERIEDRSEFRRLAACTSIISPYYKECYGLRRISEKLLCSVKPHIFSVSCALDFWIWVESQRYFQLLSPMSIDPSVLQLFDMGLENCSNAWCTPLEDMEDQIVDSNSCITTDLETFHQHFSAVQFVLNFDESEKQHPTIEDDQSNSQRVAVDDKWLNMDDAIMLMENDLASLSQHINCIIKSTRHNTVETVSFWGEQDAASKCSMVEGIVLKRYNKAKKRKRTN